MEKTMNYEEKVTKLMEKTGVSREDAEGALRACSEDILDAILYLEMLGKVRRPEGSFAGTETAFDNGPRENNNDFTKNIHKDSSNPEEGRSTFSKELGKFFGCIGRLIKKGMNNYLDVTKDGNCNFSIPLTILVFLFIPFFWMMTILLLVLLLCGYRYEFRGPDFRSDDNANRMLNNASNACNAAKEEFKKGFADGNRDNK